MKNLNDKMSAIVEGYMTNYKDDYYIHDANKLKTMKSGIWSIRATGTDITDTDDIFNAEFFNPQYRNTPSIPEAAKSVIIWHERNQRFFLIENNDIKEIKKDKALQILEKKATNELQRKFEALKKELQPEFINL